MASIEHHPRRAAWYVHALVARGLDVARLARVTAVVGLGIALRPAATAGQTVRGDVRDDQSGRALAGVSVLVLTAGLDEVARARTATDGRFQITVPEPGHYRLRFEMPGYRLLMSSAINLAAGQEVNQSIRLAPLPPVTLDTVLAEGRKVPWHLEDFYRRRAARLGESLTKEEFERWSPGETTDIVRRLRGFTVQRLDCSATDPLGGSPQGCRMGLRWRIDSRRSGTGMGSGWCPPVIFVDGVRLGDAKAVDLNDRLFVENLDAIEAYHSLAKMPTELNVTGSQCGVLVLWTKR